MKTMFREVMKVMNKELEKYAEGKLYVPHVSNDYYNTYGYYGFEI